MVEKCYLCKRAILNEYDTGGVFENKKICSSCIFTAEVITPQYLSEEKLMENVQPYQPDKTYEMVSIDKLTKLKELMYNIITCEPDTTDPNISAKQGMGVNISNAIKKDGVNIIQMQNVTNHKVTTIAINSLRLIDEIVQNTIINEAEKHKKPNIEVIEESNNKITIEHVIQVIEWLADKEYDLKFFDRFMRGLYAREIVDRTGSTIKASKILGVSQSQSSKLKREVEDAIDIVTGNTKSIPAPKQAKVEVIDDKDDKNNES